MSKIYFYKVYGLNIKSSLELPELIPGNEDYDIIIRFTDNNSALMDLSEEKYESSESSLSRSTVPYYFDDELIFNVKGGKEIIINSKTSINKVFLRLLILSQGFGIILHQRGYIVLHGSAVKIDNQAIAFLGHSGIGKSTLTAALNERCFHLIADDVLAIKIDGDKYSVYPSFSRIKLYDDVIEHLKYYPNSYTKVHPEFQKYNFKTGNNFSIKPVPIKTIFILEKNEKNQIKLLKPQEKLIELAKNSYLKPIFKKTDKSHNLLQCTNLAKKTDIKKLEICHSFKKLNEIIKIIENDSSN